MPSLKDIKKRIGSVKNTRQITKAMKMVSAAKLRRAQDAVVAARPYANKMLEVLSSLALREEPGAHALLTQRGKGRALVLLLTADRGLCGGFNGNVSKAAERFIRANAEAVKAIAKKIEALMKEHPTRFYDRFVFIDLRKPGAGVEGWGFERAKPQGAYRFWVSHVYGPLRLVRRIERGRMRAVKRAHALVRRRGRAAAARFDRADPRLRHRGDQAQVPSGAPPEEEITVPLKKGQTILLAACNWLGQPDVLANFEGHFK